MKRYASSLSGNNVRVSIVEVLVTEFMFRARVTIEREKDAYGSIGEIVTRSSNYIFNRNNKFPTVRD